MTKLNKTEQLKNLKIRCELTDAINKNLESEIAELKKVVENLKSKDQIQSLIVHKKEDLSLLIYSIDAVKFLNKKLKNVSSKVVREKLEILLDNSKLLKECYLNELHKMKNLIGD